MIDARARRSSGAGTGLRYLLCGLGLLLALLTASCGNDTFVPGTPMVTLTAEPGRFTSYIVYIDQIYFTKDDGSTAVLPLFAEHVDLAHLSTNDNIFTLAPIQEGTYTSATLELNYSGSYITYDVNGKTVQVSPIDPATSAAAGAIAVTLKFDPSHPLVINSQTSTPLSFAIDLEASNLVTVASDGTYQASVKPFWTGTTVPAYDKQLYARGLFVLADTQNSNLVMNTRPLFDLSSAPVGALTVNTNDQTYFQINGTTYVGAAGLTALAGLQNTYSNLQVSAYGPSSGNPYGSLANIQPSMTATAVYVGSSQESTIEEKVTGFVAGINGSVLTVQDAAYVDHFGYLGFARTLPVTVGSNTIVSVDGVPGTPTLSTISVGQYVTALGVGTETYDTTLLLAYPTALDLTGSVITGAQIRLQNSTFYGTVNSVSPGTMSVSMVSIGNYAPSDLSFVGTGAGGADATAANYTVATGTLDVSAITPGTLVKVDGMPTAFGSGPPYFTASAITPASQLSAELVLEWPGGSASPFSAISGNGITVNLADTALQSGTAMIRTGPVTTIPNLLSQQPNPGQLQITFNTSNSAQPPLYAVGSVALGEYLYSDPSAFANQIQTVVNGTNTVLKMVAKGQYDPATGTFTATSVSINAK